ncbi:biotin--[acetyl-CoA-carboxylase] ligase [Nemorincola caseinilytica]|uniref:Biotin--[acetyl-CoA-carboxylase] ligase n=1 Tax=Nemorincola caseinilytica TaxID=2054315 RepID=A0ABP8NR01_9BACT
MTNSDRILIKLDTTDSTNNYAMQLVNDDKAHHGLTITARSQYGGKGQRGRKWADTPNKSLLMSIVLTPRLPISAQFVFSASVATAVANILQNLLRDKTVRVKWPNDIIVNDKKAGGILIENALRGNMWTHSIVGLGLNVLQSQFPQELPYATSLKIATGEDLDIDDIRDEVRSALLALSGRPVSIPAIMEAYNAILYKRGEQQLFGKGEETWQATVIQAHDDGTLEVRTEDNRVAFYTHGDVRWIYE